MASKTLYMQKMLEELQTATEALQEDMALLPAKMDSMVSGLMEVVAVSSQGINELTVKSGNNITVNVLNNEIGSNGNVPVNVFKIKSLSSGSAFLNFEIKAPADTVVAYLKYTVNGINEKTIFSHSVPFESPLEYIAKQVIITFNKGDVLNFTLVNSHVNPAYKSYINANTTFSYDIINLVNDGGLVVV